MKVTLETVNLVRDLTTTTAKIVKKDKFELADLATYAPYLAQIQNTKANVELIPEEIKTAKQEDVKVLANAVIDSAYGIYNAFKNE